MNQNIQIHISPRILPNVASLYTDPSRVIMEYIDNSLDAAEHEFNTDNDSYHRKINITIKIEKNIYNPKIQIIDNCCGMTSQEIKRIIENIGDSNKKGQSWLNGEFGFGVYSFLAICNKLQITSKSGTDTEYTIQLEKEMFDQASSKDVKVPINDSNIVNTKTGTIVILSDFDRETLREIDVEHLKDEIETHFNRLLNRKNLEIKIESNHQSTTCTAFDYLSLEGDQYEDTITKYTFENRGSIVTKHFDNTPIQVFLKITPNKDIGRRPILYSKGRRISEIKDIRSFNSNNKQRIWNHSNLTGFVEVNGFVSPNIARNDFKKNQSSGILFRYLKDLETLIQDLIDRQNKNAEEQHYQKLEHELNKALAELSKLDNSLIKERTEYITGSEFATTTFSEGVGLDGNEGKKDRGDKHSSPSPSSIGEEEGTGIGKGGFGNLPSTPEKDGQVPSNIPSDVSQLEAKNLRTTKKSGIQVRIVDRDLIETTDPYGKTVYKRSDYDHDSILIFKQHPDFIERVKIGQTGAHKITQRLITYLAGEILVHYKHIFHNKKGAPQYDRWLFIDLTDGLYRIEKMLQHLVDKNLSDLSDTE